MKKFALALLFCLMGAQAFAYTPYLKEWSTLGSVPDGLIRFLVQDIRSDTLPEIIGITEHEVIVYGLEENGKLDPAKPRVITRYKGGNHEDFVNLDYLGANPAPQFLLSRVINQRARPVLLEYRKGVLRLLSEDLPSRLFNQIDGQIFGQALSSSKGYSKKVSLYTWDPSKRTMQHKEKITLPKNSNIFGLATVSDHRFFVNQDDKILVYNKNKRISRSSEHYGGTTNYFDFIMKNAHNAKTGEQLFLQPDPLVISSNKDETFILALKNYSRIKRLMSRIPLYYKTRIVLLKWRNGVLFEADQSQAIEGYASDMVRYIDNTGSKLYVALQHGSRLGGKVSADLGLRTQIMVFGETAPSAAPAPVPTQQPIVAPPVMEMPAQQDLPAGGGRELKE